MRRISRTRTYSFFGRPISVFLYVPDLTDGRIPIAVCSQHSGVLTCCVCKSKKPEVWFCISPECLQAFCYDGGRDHSYLHFNVTIRHTQINIVVRRVSLSSVCRSFFRKTKLIVCISVCRPCACAVICASKNVPLKTTRGL